ncbi:CDK9 kinase-activating protein cyclin T [Handroanthus impetiginosus]|uniref:CDK9 kinase-activating protein cyclin T n=1 Tax=Handroanthus impetiginosus TaxID=429701 RepID=A0A2G9HVL9_9LAMI|nr:CDK9 kinase-activating protein cyclin T [Handroanthus impetiginosus]
MHSAGVKDKETMARQMPGNPSQSKVLGEETCVCSQEEPISLKPKWYFTKEEIEEHSPSRKDGITREYESHLRQLYCSYLQELGMELKVPQVTIATAIMLCHRFYMHQSHSKNHWQTVANASMFLASKAEDTPRWLKDIVVVAYKLMYSWDPSAPQRIRQKEVYDKQKQLILQGEQLILVTVAFDLNIEHPYKPLVAALKRLGISQKEVVKVAWNFVNDWLRTTLCLQYKPQYIAAGSVFLATKLQKIKLSILNGTAWWMQFDVSPGQLEEVIQHMLQLLGQNSKQAVPASSELKNEPKPVAGKRKSGSSELHISSGLTIEQDSSNYTKETARMTLESAVVKGNEKQPKPNADYNVKTTENCLSDSSSANSVVEDSDAELITGDSNQESLCKIVSVKDSCQKIDIARIRERLKRRKLDRRVENKKSAGNLKDEIDGEAWIERELENGIELVSAAV